MTKTFAQKWQADLEFQAWSQLVLLRVCQEGKAQSVQQVWDLP